MKLTFVLPMLAMALAGCCSYTEIGRPAVPCTADDGVSPIASVTVFNTAYSLFGVLPLESGTTWKEGPYARRDTWNATFFADRCTLDENLASVRAALGEIGSNKTLNLVSETESWRLWSLFIIKRKILKTSCVVLK